MRQKKNARIENLLRKALGFRIYTELRKLGVSKNNQKLFVDKAAFVACCVKSRLPVQKLL